MFVYGGGFLFCIDGFFLIFLYIILMYKIEK